MLSTLDSEEHLMKFVQSRWLLIPMGILLIFGHGLFHLLPFSWLHEVGMLAWSAAALWSR